jgi:uncharacterized protein (DUF305 family)
MIPVTTVEADDSPVVAPDNRPLLLGITAALMIGILVGLWLSRDRNPAESSADVGFLRDMVDHHEQATVMASIALSGDVDPQVNRFAQEVLVSQRWETGLMDAWLERWAFDRGDPDRTDAMGWMGDPGPLAAMPGIQPSEALDDLAGETDPTAKSVQFLTMMIDHHRGGVAMAEAAMERADTERVRDFALLVARNQEGEIAEYLRLLARLDPEAAATIRAGGAANGGGGDGGHGGHGG